MGSARVFLLPPVAEPLARRSRWAAGRVGRAHAADSLPTWDGWGLRGRKRARPAFPCHCAHDCARLGPLLFEAAGERASPSRAARGGRRASIARRRASITLARWTRRHHVYHEAARGRLVHGARSVFCLLRRAGRAAAASLRVVRAPRRDAVLLSWHPTAAPVPPLNRPRCWGTRAAAPPAQVLHPPRREARAVGQRAGTEGGALDDPTVRRAAAGAGE